MIDADFARQDGMTSQTAHRNRFLSEMLRNADDEVRRKVEENRRKPDDIKQTEYKFRDSENLPAEELERRRFALKRSE